MNFQESFKQMRLAVFPSVSCLYICYRTFIYRFIMFLMFRYPDVAERQRMLWDAKYQTISKQLNITEAQEKKIKGKLELPAEIF